MSKNCPECGYPLNGNESQCPECGQALQNQTYQQNYNYYEEDEGDNDAEDVLRTYLNLFKKWVIVLSVIVGILAAIGGIVLLANGIPSGVPMIILAVIIIIINIVIAKLIWAAGMIFINISTNVRKIKQIVKTKR